MKDIQKKNDSELKQFIAEKREELRTLRFKASGSGLRDVKLLHTLKKEIAQAQTVQSARRNALTNVDTNA